MSEAFLVRAAGNADLAAWRALRAALWPDQEEDEDEDLAAELQRDDAASFLAYADGVAIGFADAALRRDYVNGTDASPVGFLEGWYVRPAWRGRGVGRALLRHVLDWTGARGCSELASDALLDDVPAQAAHRACGFEETERVVYFRMPVRG